MPEISTILPEETIPRDEDVIRGAVARAAAEAHEFRYPSWRFVVNTEERSIYGVAPGLYPDLVALDGSEMGTAWVMEVATPSTIIEETTWDRWAQISLSGLSFILAVPYGCGNLATKVAQTLGIRVGMLYEYGLGPSGVIFPAAETLSRPSITH